MGTLLAFPIPGLISRSDGVAFAAAGTAGGAGSSAALQAARARDTARVAEWAARIVEGDVQALEALMAAYASSLTRFAATVVTSASLAEEVVQDVFVRLWDRRASLDASGNVIGYLYRSVRNRALTVARQERTRSAAEAVSSSHRPEVVGNFAVEALDAEGLRAEILVALQAVPPRCREIFWLIVDGHLRYDEAAGVCGIGVRSVQNQYYKAVAALADHLNRRVSR
jgi:RNA polymerase sigma-70 factor (ECF subfamily)